MGSSRCPMRRTCWPAGCAARRASTRRCSSRRTGVCWRRPPARIFWVKDGALLTPPLDDHILASITRAAVIEVDRGRGARLHARGVCEPPMRRSSPRPRARCSRSRPSTITSSRASGPVTRAGRRAHEREHPSRSSPTTEDPHRHRQPAAVRQGRGGLTEAARSQHRGGAGPHRPAFRRRAFRRLLRRARACRPPTGSWRSRSARTPRRRRGCSPRSNRCSHEMHPDAVLVYGDTNSTLAGALAGAQAGVPVAHVEAGMRSFDRSMPEELNRVLTDHASSLLLCSTRPRSSNLRREGDAGCDRARRRRDGRRGARRAAAGHATRTDLVARARARARASTCWPPRTGRATSTTPSGWRSSWSCCSQCRVRSCFAAASRAPGRGSWRRAARPLGAERRGSRSRRRSATSS